MNNKGFSLIELLVSLVVLSMVSVISFVSITNIINKNKDDNCERLVKNIEYATKEYVSDNRYGSIPDNTINDKLTMKASILKEYINKIINPYNNNEIPMEDINIDVSLNEDYTVNKIDIDNEILNKCQK